MICVLRVYSGTRPGACLWLRRDQTVEVGRTTTAEFSIADDVHMSRRHFVVEGVPQGFQLRDLGSRNGTILNGSKVGIATLRNGDLIRAGGTHFQINITEDAPPLNIKPLPGSTLSSVRMHEETQMISNEPFVPIRTLAARSNISGFELGALPVRAVRRDETTQEYPSNATLDSVAEPSEEKVATANSGKPNTASEKSSEAQEELGTINSVTALAAANVQPAVNPLPAKAQPTSNGEVGSSAIHAVTSKTVIGKTVVEHVVASPSFKAAAVTEPLPESMIKNSQDLILKDWLKRFSLSMEKVTAGIVGFHAKASTDSHPTLLIPSLGDRFRLFLVINREQVDAETGSLLDFCYKRRGITAISETLFVVDETSDVPIAKFFELCLGSDSAVCIGIPFGRAWSPVMLHDTAGDLSYPSLLHGLLSQASELEGAHFFHDVAFYLFENSGSGAWSLFTSPSYLQQVIF